LKVTSCSKYTLAKQRRTECSTDASTNAFTLAENPASVILLNDEAAGASTRDSQCSHWSNSVDAGTPPTVLKYCTAPAVLMKAPPPTFKSIDALAESAHANVTHIAVNHQKLRAVHTVHADTNRLLSELGSCKDANGSR
jgi:hypothetical protein